MKNYINKGLLAILAGSLFSLNSCESDALVDDVVDGTTRGAVLRTIDRDGSFDIFRTGDTFSLVLEEQDRQNGALLDKVEVSLTFTDNNFEDEEDETDRESVSKTLLATIVGSEFSTGDRGFPQTNFEFTLQEALTLFNLDRVQLLPDDVITVDLELFLTDGRTFSASNSAGTVTGGSFYASPYQYVLTIDDGIDFNTFTTLEETGRQIDLTPLLNGEMVDYIYDIDATIDDGEGNEVETLKVYKSFIDRIDAADGANFSFDEEEILEVAVSSLTTVSNSEIVEGANVYKIDLSLNDILGTDVTITDLSVGDQFQFRYELITTDGRTITSNTFGTEYYDTVDIVQCTPPADFNFPLEGKYSVSLSDSGDENGWDGAELKVIIDGVTKTFTVADGKTSASGSFTIAEDAETFEVIYVSGNFEEEHSFTITDPNGNSAVERGPFHPDSPSGIEYVIDVPICD